MEMMPTAPIRSGQCAYPDDVYSVRESNGRLTVPASAHIPMMYTHGQNRTTFTCVPASAHIPMMYTCRRCATLIVKVPASAHIPMMYTKTPLSRIFDIVPASAHIPMMYTRKAITENERNGSGQCAYPDDVYSTTGT